jgi:fatty-acyl-CoA synthase
MKVEVRRELARRLPNVRLWKLYGQTGIAPLATMLGPQDQLRKPGSCGRAVLNVETRVVDKEMRDVAPGQIGEVVHRSPHLMLGYFHDDERIVELHLRLAEPSRTRSRTASDRLL